NSSAYISVLPLKQYKTRLAELRLWDGTRVVNPQTTVDLSLKNFQNLDFPLSMTLTPIMMTAHIM
ncbi:hypothetical protein L0F63_004148, partial [Massospora cicadina]